MSSSWNKRQNHDEIASEVEAIADIINYREITSDAS